MSIGITLVAVEAIGEHTDRQSRARQVGIGCTDRGTSLYEVPLSCYEVGGCPGPGHRSPRKLQIRQRRGRRQLLDRKPATHVIGEDARTSQTDLFQRALERL